MHLVMALHFFLSLGRVVIDWNEDGAMPSNHCRTPLTKYMREHLPGSISNFPWLMLCLLEYLTKNTNTRFHR